jgi:hypothetical protein
MSALAEEAAASELVTSDQPSKAPEGESSLTEAATEDPAQIGRRTQ